MTHIFVTHTHRDHSPGVPPVKQATGALVLADERRAKDFIAVNDQAAVGLLWKCQLRGFRFYSTLEC